MESKIQKCLIRTNIKKRISCSSSYRLVCVDDKFSKFFKIYLGEDTVCNFINILIEKSKYCSDMIKNILTKNL